jgi:amidase
LNQATLVPAFMVLWATNLAAGIDHVARLTGQMPSADKFEGLTWGLYQAGKRVTASEYLLAKGATQLASRSVAKFHEKYDVCLSSTLAAPPVKLGTFDMEERDPQKSFAPLIDYVQFTAVQNATASPRSTCRCTGTMRVFRSAPTLSAAMATKRPFCSSPPN